MVRIAYQALADTLGDILRRLGFSAERAGRCARLIVDTSRDGVYSHGLNRFPRLVRMIEQGVVDVRAAPRRTHAFGALERWDGNRGPGNLNAHAAMERALALSRKYGLGCVALGNTNHWMRGGSYGWQAAEAGAVGLCWTNTQPNLPPWGAREARIGNNPLVIAVPRPQGHVVLDMAMSQFSYGTLAEYRLRGEALPVDGGFDASGSLTRDPAAIEASGRPLPIGSWKGSGLALLLDMVAVLLSGGLATHQIDPDPLLETGLSQVFLALHPAALGAEAVAGRIVDEIIEDLHAAAPVQAGARIFYPGEQTLQQRRENMERGIPVDPSIWEQVRALHDSLG